jgi:membrane-associated phospholipid phosphatase
VSRGRTVRRVAQAGTSLAFAVLAATASPAWATDELPAGPPPPHQPGVPSEVFPADGRRTMGQLPTNLGRGLIGVFNGDNLVPLLVGGVASSTASFFDADTKQAAVGQLSWSDTFETAGGPVYSTLFVAGMFTAGRFAGGPRFRAMTYDMLDAAVVNFTYTQILKVTVGRERPDGSDNQSFPSGHTSQAFAMATVAERHYGWKIGVPAYALAGLMGASRIHQDKHWLSDVVAGATLGYIAGRTVVRLNSRPLERLTSGGAKLSVSPIVSRRACGLQMSMVF